MESRDCSMLMYDEPNIAFIYFPKQKGKFCGLFGMEHCCCLMCSMDAGHINFTCTRRDHCPLPLQSRPFESLICTLIYTVFTRRKFPENKSDELPIIKFRACPLQHREFDNWKCTMHMHDERFYEIGARAEQIFCCAQRAHLLLTDGIKWFGPTVTEPNNNGRPIIV